MGIRIKMTDGVAPSASGGKEPIVLNIDITKEDCIKSAVFDSRRILKEQPGFSRKLRRHELRTFIIVTLFLGIPAAYIGYDERHSLSSAGGWIIIFVLMVLSVGAIRVGKLIFMLSKSKTIETAVIVNATAFVDMRPGLTGHHMVSLSAAELLISTSDVIRKFMWKGIKYVAESESEFFILPAVGALVVPKRGMSTETINAVRSNLERYTTSGNKIDHVAEIDISSNSRKRERLESVRDHSSFLANLLSMRRIEASSKNPRALRLRHSQSLANRRQRPSQASVRSTTHRFGWTTKPLA
jgi:hypothetical protein